jgi:hypothetical protein
MTDDGIGCTVTSEVFSTDEEQIASLDRLPCPISIAWAEKDALLPVELYEKVARARLPQATFEILPGVGPANDRRSRASGAHHPRGNKRGGKLIQEGRTGSECAWVLATTSATQ